MMSVRKYCMYLSSSSTRSQHWNINIEPLYLDYMRPLCSERAQMELATAVHESIHGSHSPHELHGYQESSVLDTVSLDVPAGSSVILMNALYSAGYPRYGTGPGLDGKVCTRLVRLLVDARVTHNVSQ